MEWNLTAKKPPDSSGIYLIASVGGELPAYFDLLLYDSERQEWSPAVDPTWIGYKDPPPEYWAEIPDPPLTPTENLA